MFQIFMFENVLKISDCVEICNTCWKLSKFQGVLKMFMLGMLKTMLKTMLKYEKTNITLYSACWN